MVRLENGKDGGIELEYAGVCARSYDVRGFATALSASANFVRKKPRPVLSMGIPSPRSSRLASVGRCSGGNDPLQDVLLATLCLCHHPTRKLHDTNTVGLWMLSMVLTSNATMKTAQLLSAPVLLP